MTATQRYRLVVLGFGGLVAWNAFVADKVDDSKFADVALSVLVLMVPITAIGRAAFQPAQSMSDLGPTLLACMGLLALLGLHACHLV